MNEEPTSADIPDEQALREVAASFRMDTDPARLDVYAAHMTKLRADIEALENLDLGALEPAATFDPRWD